MKVLFLTPPAPEQTPFSTFEKRPPLGVGSLIGSLMQADKQIEVALIDNYLSPHPFLTDMKVAERLFNGVDYVGLYTNTICLRGVRHILNILKFLRDTGKWHGEVICGGPHASVRPQDLATMSDYVVLGEGEQAIVDLVQGRGDIRKPFTQGQRITNLDTLPPLPWQMFVSQPYKWTMDWTNDAPIFTMNTSRGCPYGCAFCSVQSIWGRKYTYMSAERVVDDVQEVVRRYGAKGVYFREDNFFASRERVEKFVELLLHHNIYIQWAAEARADDILRCEGLLGELQSSGLTAIYMGIETGCQHVMNNLLHKNLHIGDIEKAVMLLARHQIQVAGSFMVGVPGETEGERKETMEFASRLPLQTRWWNVFVGIPDSPLYKEIKDGQHQEWLAYEDDRGLLYGKEHDALCTYFYRNQWDAGIPVDYDSPLVSVIVTTYNNAGTLAASLDSLFNQTLQNMEIILVNDGSTDDTDKISAVYEATAKRKGRIFRTIHLDANGGISHAKNVGIRAAQGKYIAFHDSDDFSMSCRLHRQSAFLDSHPDVVMVGCQFYTQDSPQSQYRVISVPTTDTVLRNRLVESNQFCHGSVMVVGDVMRELLYDESLPAAQDYELWSRMLEKGKVANLPHPPEYVWVQSEGSVTNTKQNKQQQVAAMVKSRLKTKGDNSMVSVIIPTFNRPLLLKRAVESVLAQRYQNFEIIVVNDGGENVDFILNFDRRIRLLQHDKNLGLAATRNTGLSKATGGLIAFLDDDDYLLRRHFSTHLNAISEGHKLSYSDAVFVVEQDGHEIKRELRMSKPFDRWELLVHNLFPVNAAVMQRELFDKVGLFDESLTTHEDWDLWIRMANETNFHHIRLITCAVSDRVDTMTCQKREDFYRTMKKIHERYKSYYVFNPDMVRRIKERHVIDEQLLGLQERGA